MKKLMSVAAVAILVSGLAACQTPEERAVGGALLGAAAGAAIGGAATGKWGGAAAGAAIGGVGGALVGAASAPRAECARWGRDYYGNPVCVRYYRY
jgi:uncharacterized membrane protein